MTISLPASIPAHFTAFRIDEENGIAGRLARVALSELSAGEVIVRNAFSGLNYKDALATTTSGRVIRQFPRIGGSDVVGTVLASTAPAWSPGDRVMAFANGLGVTHDGGFSPIVRLAATRLRRIPADLSLFEAASIGLAGYTAALAIHLLQESGAHPDGGEILVTGASGGVGSHALGMLRRQGYRVTAVSSKADSHDWLREAGAHMVIPPEDVLRPTAPLAHARWQGAIDNVGGSMLAALTRAIQPRGVVACVGNASGNDTPANVLPFVLRGIRWIGVNVSLYPERQDAIWNHLAGPGKPADLAARTQCIDLDALPAAIRRMLDGHTRGRTLVAL